MVKFEDALEEIRKWRESNNISIADVARKMEAPYEAIKDLLRGRIKYLSDDRRNKLYEITRLEILNEPVEPLSEGYIKLQADKSKTDKELTRSEPSVPLREGKRNDITRLLKNIEGSLKSLKIDLAQKASSYDAADLLKEDYKPTYEERVRVVETAIDLLVEQINYFKSSPQGERENLVRYLRDLGEIERWGYVVNVFGGITKQGNTPDTFARTLDSPQKNKKTGKN